MDAYLIGVLALVPIATLATLGAAFEIAVLVALAGLLLVAAPVAVIWFGRSLE